MTEELQVQKLYAHLQPSNLAQWAYQVTTANGQVWTVEVMHTGTTCFWTARREDGLHREGQKQPCASREEALDMALAYIRSCQSETQMRSAGSR